MSGYLGNDPHQVELLGRHLLHGAQSLEELRSRLTTELFHSTWAGYDADEAQAEWATCHAPALGVTAELLRHMSAVAFANAAQQEQASQADGGGGGSAGGGGAGGGGGAFPAGQTLLDSLLILLNGLGIVVDVAGIGIDVADFLLPGVRALGAVSLGFGVLGVGLDIVDFVTYLNSGDAGGVIMSGTAVVLGGASVIIGGAVVAGLIAAAPVTIAVGLGLGLAAAGISLAANIDPIREWVGDRWDDTYEFTTGLVDDVTDGVRSGFDTVVSTTGDFVEGVGDFASDALGTGREVFDAIF